MRPLSTRWRKVGTTSNHHALYDLGYTRTTMVVNRGKQDREVEQIPKSHPSSDCRLKPACMKLELLVIVNQHVTVNTFPGLVHTARQTMRVGNARSLLEWLPTCLLRKEVIQPLVLERLPCYDFTPIIEPTFGRALLAVKLRTSGVPDSHGVTGGVYKARERIHRGMLIRDY